MADVKPLHGNPNCSRVSTIPAVHSACHEVKLAAPELSSVKRPTKSNRTLAQLDHQESMPHSLNNAISLMQRFHYILYYVLLYARFSCVNALAF